MQTPCAHLIEGNPPACEMGRRIPQDCRLACAQYAPGLNDQERTRCEVWTGFAPLIGEMDGGPEDYALLDTGSAP